MEIAIAKIAVQRIEKVFGSETSSNSQVIGERAGSGKRGERGVLGLPPPERDGVAPPLPAARALVAAVVARPERLRRQPLGLRKVDLAACPAE